MDKKKKKQTATPAPAIPMTTPESAPALPPIPDWQTKLEAILKPLTTEELLALEAHVVSYAKDAKQNEIKRLQDALARLGVNVAPAPAISIPAKSSAPASSTPSEKPKGKELTDDEKTEAEKFVWKGSLRTGDIFQAVKGRGIEAKDRPRFALQMQHLVDSDKAKKIGEGAGTKYELA